MPKTRPMRALVLAVCSLALSSILIFGVPPTALAAPSGPEPGEAVVFAPLEGGKPLSQLQRAEIITYRIKSGDTLWDIAAAHDIDVDTIRWSNPDVARNPDSVALGTELVILPIKGAYVTVQPGETVVRLADRWGVAPDDIVNYPANKLRGGRGATRQRQAGHPPRPARCQSGAAGIAANRLRLCLADPRHGDAGLRACPSRRRLRRAVRREGLRGACRSGRGPAVVAGRLWLFGDRRSRGWQPGLLQPSQGRVG